MVKSGAKVGAGAGARVGAGVGTGAGVEAGTGAGAGAGARVEAGARAGVEIGVQKTAKEGVEVLLPSVGVLSGLLISISLPPGRRLRQRLRQVQGPTIAWLKVENFFQTDWLTRWGWSF